MKAHRKVVTLFVIALAVALAASTAACAGDSEEEGPEKLTYTLIYYDGHMHTTHSDGSGSVSDIKETALSRGLSAVIITDHCEELTREKWDSLVADTGGASDDSFLALLGFEITGKEGLLNRDHILAYNVADPFVGNDADELCPEEVWPSPANPEGTGAANPENVAQWVEYVHSQGGIAVHAHPAGTTRLEYGVNNIEVYNQSQIDDIVDYAKMLGTSDEEALGFAMMLANTATYGERDLNTPVSFPDSPTPISLKTVLQKAVNLQLGSPEAPLNSWDDLLMAYVDGALPKPIFALAGSDAHNTGDPDSKVGVAKNGLYVTELTAAAVYEAIEAGRNFATTGPSLAFDVDGKMMGETVQVASGESVELNLKVDSESPSALLVKIDIIKNGEVLKTIDPQSPTHEVKLVDDVTEPGYYRVEVTARDPASGRDYFAWSNPVFVEAS